MKRRSFLLVASICAQSAIADPSQYVFSTVIKKPLIGEEKLRKQKETAELEKLNLLRQQNAKLEQKSKWLASISSLEPITVALFPVDQHHLSKANRRALQKVRETLLSNKGEIVVAGHCDETGSKEYNEKLGLKRAEEVKRYLVKLGIDEKRISTVSYGKRMPVIKETGEIDSYNSRRVELHVIEGV